MASSRSPCEILRCLSRQHPKLSYHRRSIAAAGRQIERDLELRDALDVAINHAFDIDPLRGRRHDRNADARGNEIKPRQIVVDDMADTWAESGRPAGREDCVAPLRQFATLASVNDECFVCEGPQYKRSVRTMLPPSEHVLAG